MSNTRAICWMIVAIVVSAAMHFLLDIKGPRSARMIRRTVLASSADKATAVSVKRADEPATVMSSASGVWMIVSPFHANADRQSVLKLIDELSFEPIIDSMGDSELRKLDRRRQDFGLVFPRLVVETLGHGGSETVLFGNHTPAGDGVYAAVDGEDAVYVVSTNLFAAANKSTSDFRSRLLFSIGEDEIGAFDLRRAKGGFARFVRSGGVWRMAEPDTSSVSPARVKKFLTDVLASHAVDFVWPIGASNETSTATASLLAGYGLDPESAITLTLKGVDGIDRQVSFGKESSDGLVYALTQNAGSVVTVDASLKDMVLSDTESLIDRRLFSVDESAVSFVSIIDGDVQCILAKGQDGLWRMDAPVSALADSVAVSDLVSRLLSLNVRGESADDDVKVSVSTNSAAISVPRDVVLAEGGFEAFRSREIASVSALQIRRLVVTRRNVSPVAVVYDLDRRAWNVETSSSKGVADVTAIDAILRLLDPFMAVETVKLRVGPSELARYGLADPMCSIAIDRAQEDSLRRNIRIGDKVNGGYYATFGSADAVFVISEDAVGILTTPLVK